MYEFFPGNYRWSYNTLLAFSAGAQLGDVASIHEALLSSDGDDETWQREWATLADTLEMRATAAGASRYSATENMLLASLYHTISEHFIQPADPRRLESYHEVLRCFEKARDLSPDPIERVEIPFEGTTLPAYFVKGVGEGLRPVAIFICGLDTTKELWFLRARDQFAKRGISSLFIDTPGIGEALRLRKLVTRADYERPVDAAIDYLETRDDVAKDKIGLVGSSLGGYYVARAAAFCPRLAAVVAWGAIYDYHRVWVRRMEGNGIAGAPKFQLMFITGTDTMEAAIEAVSEFRIASFADKIVCPFLIMHGAEDRQVTMEDAHEMYAAIPSTDKEMVIFNGPNGGAAHTQFDNHLPALQVCSDWIAAKLLSSAN